MVRAMRERGPKAADGIGNNEVNRRNRQSLNTAIIALVAQNTQEMG